MGDLCTNKVDVVCNYFGIEQVSGIPEFIEKIREAR
jgi:hypothetical protein